MLPRFAPSADSDRRPNTMTDAARRVELDHHVGAFIDGPDVVVLVDPNGVGLRPCVQALADFPQELAVGAELEQLRRRRTHRPDRRPYWSG